VSSIQSIALCPWFLFSWNKQNTLNIRAQVKKKKKKKKKKGKRNSGPSASIITDNQERYSQIPTKHHATMIYICINLKEIHKSRGKLLPHITLLSSLNEPRLTKFYWIIPVNSNCLFAYKLYSNIGQKLTQCYTL